MISLAVESAMFKFIKDYLLNSTLHGFHFIAESDYHWSEKLFWVICCLFSWIGSALLIKSSWDNFQNSAISFVVETTYLDVDTKFPSISACEDDYQMGQIYDVAMKLFGYDHDCNLDEVLKEIAYFHGTAYYIKEFCFGENIYCPKSDYAEIASEIRSTCQEMFVHCKWRGQPFNCCEHFHSLQTEFGTCFTLSPKFERGKNNSLNMISNTKYGLASLYIELKIMAKLYMHSESDLPYYNTLTTDILEAPPNIHKKFTISVTAIENEEEVHQLSVQQRRCRFPYENYLTVSDQYSYSGCITECRKSEQLQLCNCTSHLMPNTAKDLHCDMQGMVCLNDHYASLAGPKTRWSLKAGLRCRCLPGCDEPEYSIVTTSGIGVETNHSKVEIVMDRLPSKRYKRNVVRGRLDLVVSMGGAASLFVGASILSFIEIIYYFTFRLRRYNQTGEEINNNDKTGTNQVQMKDQFFVKTINVQSQMPNISKMSTKNFNIYQRQITGYYK